jgi:septal ring factor EnvC (AmiA/AmiB activator)
MSDSLKDFIHNNRQEFESENPPAGIWDDIEKKVARKAAPVFYMKPVFRWNIAAAVLLVVVSSIYYFASVDQVGDVQGINKEASVLQESDYNRQMRQFMKVIDIKQEELKQIAVEQPELYQKFTAAIDQLDSSYNKLKNQLAVTPNREMLLEAMVENLELQLKILNQQLRIIQQIKNSKNDNHEQTKQTI